MQSINQLAPQVTTKLGNQAQTSTQKTLPETLHSSTQTNSQTCLSKQQIASLFAGWKKLFRSKIKDEDWGVDTLTVWYIALTDLGMTQDEFNQAKRKSLSLSWPPTAPADFLDLARAGKQSEYLDIQTAFETACRCSGMRGDVERDWRHPTVLETANRIGWGKLAGAGNGFIKYFATVYERVISEHKNGANFEIPKTHRIEAPKPARLNDDSPVSQDWEKMKARFGVGRPKQETVEV